MSKKIKALQDLVSWVNDGPSYIDIFTRSLHATAIAKSKPTEGWWDEACGRDDPEANHVPDNIKAALSRPDVCHWNQEEDENIWATGCCHYFEITDGTPKDNDMAYCCYCGEPIYQQPFICREVTK